MNNYIRKKTKPKRSEGVSIPTWAAPIVGPIVGLVVGGVVAAKMARHVDPNAEPPEPWVIATMVIGAASMGLVAGLAVMVWDIIKKK